MHINALISMKDHLFRWNRIPHHRAKIMRAIDREARSFARPLCGGVVQVCKTHSSSASKLKRRKGLDGISFLEIADANPLGRTLNQRCMHDSTDAYSPTSRWRRDASDGCLIFDLVGEEKAIAVILTRLVNRLALQPAPIDTQLVAGFDELRAHVERPENPLLTRVTYRYHVT